MEHLGGHPLYQTITKLLRYMKTEDFNAGLLMEGLRDLNKTFAGVQGQWTQVVGSEIEELLEILAHFLLGQVVYFIKEVPGPALDAHDPMVEAADQKRRPNFAKDVVASLETWLVEHAEYPYPTTEEKQGLSEQLGLSVKQINDWFINA